MRLWALTILLALCGCSEVFEVPDKLHGKLMCLQETKEAYVAYKHVGTPMILRRQEFADGLCRDQS